MTSPVETSVDEPDEVVALGEDDNVVPIVHRDSDEALLRVSASSPPQSLASAISHALYDNRRVTLRAIGAGAVNQAMKGCAIARGYVAQRGYDLVVKPGFTEVKGYHEDDLSAMVFVVKVE
jgi:stage V sporulation protein S